MKIWAVKAFIIFLDKFLYIWDVIATFLDNTQLKGYYKLLRFRDGMGDKLEELLNRGSYIEDWDDLS